MRRVRRCLALALLLLVGPLAACNPAPVAPEDASSTDATATTSADATATTSATLNADTSGGDDLDRDPVAFNCKPGAAPSDAFIDCVESFTPRDATFGQDRFPEVVYGPPLPGAPNTGSLDVLSLGCGGEITLYFDEPALVDGPGPDFVVFENPIPLGDATFAEPARVLVSADGREWHAFPCDPVGDATLRGCAGVGLVHPDVDPRDPDLAGGDAFDLAELGLDAARYVRLIDVSVEHFGGRMWCSGGGGGFDLDAIALVHPS